MTGYLEILGAVSIWAFFNGILVKGIKTSGTGVGTWTSIVGVLIFSAVFLTSGLNVTNLSYYQIIMLIHLGIFAALNNACYYTALKISIPQAALFHYLAPILVILWTWMFPIFYEPVSVNAVVAAIIGLFGMYWLAVPNWKEGNLKLIILGLASAVFYSLEIVFSGYVSNNLKVTPEISSATKLLFQALIMPVAALLLGDSLRVAGKKEGLKLLAGGVLLYVSFVFYFAGSATVSDLHRGVLGYIDRIGAILLGAWVFHEKITKNVLIGGALILGAGSLLIF